MNYLTVSLLAVFVLGASAQYMGLCYFPNWGQYRPDPMKHWPEDIDTSLCTHILFAFAHVRDHRIVTFEWNDEELYERTLALKEQNPALKVSLAVGGWNMGTFEMTKMLATQTTRSEFVTTTIDFLRQRNFDGVELDFEYPGSRGSPPEDKQKFTMLVQQLRAAFEEEAATTGNTRLLVSAAVACGSANIDAGYEIDLINPELDWIGLMSYDLNGAWESRTSFNSPLQVTDPQAPQGFEIRSLAWCSDRWLQGGATKDKVVPGIPSYGRCFTLADPLDNGLYAPAEMQSGGLYNCEAGTYTREGGILSHYEVCEEFLNEGSTVVRPDGGYENPYTYLNDQWVGYEDINSVVAKAQYIRENSLAGFMFFDLSLDDFDNQRCALGTYPLLRAIAEILPPPTGTPPTTSSTTTTTVTSTTTTPVTTTTTQTTPTTPQSTTTQSTTPPTSPSQSTTAPTSPSQSTTAPTSPSQSTTPPTSPSQSTTAPTSPSQSTTAPTSPSQSTTPPTSPSQSTTPPTSTTPPITSTVTTSPSSTATSSISTTTPSPTTPPHSSTAGSTTSTSTPPATTYSSTSVTSSSAPTTSSTSAPASTSTSAPTTSSTSAPISTSSSAPTTSSTSAPISTSTSTPTSTYTSTPVTHTSTTAGSSPTTSQSTTGHPTTTSPQASTTTTADCNTTPPPPAPSCEGLPENEHLPHADCTKFYKCSGGVANEIPCPDGLYFHPDIKNCVFQYDLSEDREYECCLSFPLAPFCCAST